MKKVLFAIMLFFTANLTHIQAGDIRILHPISDSNNNSKGTKPRSPIAPIYVEQNDYTLSFDESCIGCSVTLIDDEDNIVYTDIVDENGIVELPNNLSGDYCIQIVRGRFCFWGYISL